MVRSLITLGIMVGILVLTVVWTHSTPTTRFEGHVRTMYDHVLAEEWERAEAGLETLRAEWERRRPWLQLTKSVQTALDIDRLLARLRAAVDTRSKPDAADILADVDRLWLDLKE